jgi:hypothetical protein
MDVAPRHSVHVMLLGIVGRTVHGNSAWVLLRTGTSQQAASYFVLKFHVLSKAIRCFAVGIRYEDNKSNQSSIRSVWTSRDTAILMDITPSYSFERRFNQLEGID